MDMQKIDVVGLGASTLDMFTVVERFPETREVQKAGDMLLDGGGPVATALVTLAKLGAATAMIATKFAGCCAPWIRLMDPPSEWPMSR